MNADQEKVQFNNHPLAFDIRNVHEAAVDILSLISSVINFSIVIVNTLYRLKVQLSLTSSYFKNFHLHL